MGTENRFVPLTWMAGAFEMVGAWAVADVPAVACIRLSDGRRLWRRIDRRPLWREMPCRRWWFRIALDHHLGWASAWFERAEVRRPGISSGEENECVELLFSQLSELEPLMGLFATIDWVHELFPFVLTKPHAVVTVGEYRTLLTESCHCLFLSAVCYVFGETALSELGKIGVRKLCS